MRTPRTLVLDDDDERTMVDERFRASRKPGTGRSFRWAVLRRRCRPIVSILAAVLTFGGMSAVVYRERRVADRLRKAVDALECHQPRPVVEAAAGSGLVVAPSFGSSGALIRLSDADPLDRDELETRGANLLAANDHRAALPYYQLLSTRAPGERVFLDLVTVLRSKLRCQKREAQATCK